MEEDDRGLVMEFLDGTVRKMHDFHDIEDHERPNVKRIMAADIEMVPNVESIEIKWKSGNYKYDRNLAYHMCELHEYFDEPIRGASDILGIDRLRKLKRLNIPCSDLTFIGNLPVCLEELSIYGNSELNSLDDLSRLVNLRKLDCSFIPDITSLDFVESLLNLEELDCSECGITSLAGVKFPPNIERFWCAGNPIRDIETFDIQTQLPNLWRTDRWEEDDDWDSDNEDMARWILKN